jgi:hypothetical protein
VETSDLPGRSDLAGETPPELRIRRMLREDQLDRYLPAARRFPQKHLAHAARTQPADQPVRTHPARITNS